jgi:amidohydrolase
VVIFQPAEEGGGGARAMLADGLMERWGIGEVYGLHNMPGLAVGAFATRPGALMAAVDFFEITLTGRGGHAAQPHLAVDTMLVAGHVLVALQTVVARNLDPLQAAVLTVATVAGDSAGMFVIPQVVTLAGTVRTLDSGVQDLVERRLGEVVRGIALAHGAVAEVRYVRECGATVNGVAEAAHAVAVARGISAEVEDATPPIMPGEDFSDMLAVRPGAYMFVGNGGSAALHHPGYEFNDDALPYGASWLAGMIEARLATG